MVMRLVGFSLEEFVILSARTHAERSRLTRGSCGGDDAHLDLRSGWAWWD
jgi:hypothetical protein